MFWLMFLLLLLCGGGCDKSESIEQTQNELLFLNRISVAFLDSCVIMSLYLPITNPSLSFMLKDHLLLNIFVGSCIIVLSSI